MLARDVMTSPPITVAPDTPVAEVATVLLENRISAVPVVDAGGRMIGIVSEGDLLRRADAQTERRRPQWLELLLDRNVTAADFVKTHGNRARDVMTPDVVTVTPDTELTEIASILERRRIKRVPVVDTEGRPIGIVSRANLLHGLVAQPRAAVAEDVEVRDAEIRRRLDEVLPDVPGVDLRRINAVVKEGTVFLWGTVKSDNQRRALTVAAESIPGVVRVEDKLHHDWFPGSTG
jgi:CBS domain-containing protein